MKDDQTFTARTLIERFLKLIRTGVKTNIMIVSLMNHNKEITSETKYKTYFSDKWYVLKAIEEQILHIFTC